MPAPSMLSGAAAIITLVVGTVAWTRRNRPGGTPLAVFMLGAAIWSGANVGQLTATTLDGAVAWVNVQYVGIMLVPVGFLWFACAYTRQARWLSRRRLVALALPLVAVAVLSWTNESHGLVRSSARLVADAGGWRLEREWGVAFWIGWGYAQLLNVAATGILVHRIVATRAAFRSQGIAVLLGSFVPGFAHLLVLADVTTIDPLAFFAVTGVAFGYAIVTQGLLDVGPIDREIVLDHVADGVLVLDDRERLVDANRAALELFDLDETAVGTPIEELFADDPVLLGIATPERFETEVEIEVCGDPRSLDVRSQPISGRLGRQGRVVLLRDVTELIETERALRQSNERLAKVGDTIAHELRNPLNVAQGYLELAREGDRDALDDVDAALTRMGDIIEESRALADGDVSVRLIDLGPVVEAVLNRIDTEAITLDQPDELMLSADPRLLRQLFENLFRNAIVHGSTDGTVRIVVGGLDGGGFYVADDGPGIPVAQRSQVFEYGYTTGDGRGIGLATVRTIADVHGWTVTATESEDGGARFEFRTGE